MTYRERREAKAERLREWADKREAKSDAARADFDRTSSMIPMGQPVLVGHHSEKRHRRDLDRIDRKLGQTVEHGRKADEFRSRADNIEAAAEKAIYSDDEDAIERLEERIVELEAKRVKIKERNAAYRKEHKAELKEMGAYQRDQAMPFRGYVLQNLGGNINRNKKRLAQLKRVAERG